MATTRISSKNQLAITDHLDLSSAWRVMNMIDPVNPQDAATKAYVDAVKQGLDPKDSVRATTTANITLSGTQTIDGVALSAGDRVLVKNQTTASENGIYVVASGAWSRSTDANTSAKVTGGMYVYVSEGTTNAASGFVLTTPDPITLGTTGLSFTQFSGAGQITAGAGMTKTGNTLDVGTASSSRIVINADSIDLATTAVSAGTYGNSGYNVSNITVDAYGRLVSASNRDLFGSSLTANTVFAAPSGSSGAPTFRALVALDIPNLDAAKITTGQLTVARGGTGVDGSAAANGAVLIGNGTGYTLATITQGTGISVTNGAGSITIANTGVTSLTGTANQVNVSASTGAVTLSLPQSIATTSSPTFLGITLTGGTVTSSAPLVNATQTWNSAGTTFTGIFTNITDTASASASKLIDLQVSSTSRFTVRKDGTITVGIWGGTTIDTTVGGTGLTSYTTGDLIQATASNTLGKLAAVATGNVLISGGVGTASSWGKVGLTTHVSGTLAVSNGGTGITTTPSNGFLPIGNGTNYTAAAITQGTGITVTNGAGSITISIAGTVLSQSNIVTRETPSGSVNGSNAAFTLANTPIAGTENVFVNGIVMDPGSGNDYTISGASITFLSGSIPQTGDKVRVSYIK